MAAAGDTLRAIAKSAHRRRRTDRNFSCAMSDFCDAKATGSAEKTFAARTGAKLNECFLATAVVRNEI